MSNVLYTSEKSLVMKCKYNKNDRTYVLKSYDLASEPNSFIYMMNEVKISLSLDHENIIKTYTYFNQKSRIFLVQEYAENGDLIAFKSAYENDRVPEAIVRDKIITPLLHAVEYIHSKGIIHRDIKPENIVIMKDGVIKLCDFGLAINTYIHTPRTFAGTCEFLAPEMVNLTSAGYDESIDMWAVGCVTYELLVGNSPFYANTVDDIKHKIVHSPVNFPHNLHISSGCMTFILKLLCKECLLRMNVQEALNSDFITDSGNKSRIRRSSSFTRTSGENSRTRITENTQADRPIVVPRANSVPKFQNNLGSANSSPRHHAPSLPHRKFNLFSKLSR